MSKKNLSIIKSHWENMDTISLKDINLQLLERDVILEFLKKTERSTLKDIGCGDGSDTIYFAENFEKVYAYDYSNAMLTKASKTLSQASNITLQHLDVLQNDINPITNVVITKRMLINLGNFENQKDAIQKIYNSLDNDGYYIMLETCSNGLENLNRLRTLFSLDIIPEPFHNTLFELEALKEFLENYFIIEDIRYFSTYFFLTRVYNVILDEVNIFKYDKNAKEIVDKGIELFSSQVIGPQFCMLLKRKDLKNVAK